MIFQHCTNRDDHWLILQLLYLLQCNGPVLVGSCTNIICLVLKPSPWYTQSICLPLDVPFLFYIMQFGHLRNAKSLCQLPVSDQFLCLSIRKLIYNAVPSSSTGSLVLFAHLPGIFLFIEWITAWKWLLEYNNWWATARCSFRMGSIWTYSPNLEK